MKEHFFSFLNPKNSFSPSFFPLLQMEEKLYELTQKDSIEEVKTLLREQSVLDINWVHPSVFRWTALHNASDIGHHEIVKLLLAQPHINVNQQDIYGCPPIYYSCMQARLPCVKLLLADPRVDPTLAGNEGQTPLWIASYYWRFDIVRWLIASGRDLGDLSAKATSDDDGKKYSPLEIAIKMKRTAVVALLERYMASPAQTTHEVRVELGLPEALAAELFALTVMLCDDFLRIRPAPSRRFITLVTRPPKPTLADSAATRFFAIAAALPMELQMILCHRVFGSLKQNILSRDSEGAFKSLAQTFLSRR